MTQETKDDANRRLAKIAGQVNGLSKMVEEGRYCVDILTQVSALRAALDQFGVLMLSQHLESCVYGEEEHEGRPWTEKERLEEVKTTLNRFLK